ncbi:MAG: YitT family protein [Defluviitaleaceae bacterium]|nr:YitT family protein [Defluviitaleaceae bacterium]
MQKPILTKKLFREYLEITLGVFMMSIAIQWFYVYHSLVTGGISGLAIVFYNLWNIPLSLTNFAINVPLFLIGFKLMGIDIFVKSLYTMLMFTLALHLVTYVPPIHPSLFLSVTLGSAIVGAGTALVIKNNATSGGTVLIARLLEKLLGRFKVTTWILIADLVVITIGMLVFGIINTMYAVVAIFVIAKVADMALTGAQNSKAMYIFSDKSEEVSQALMKSINRGITSLRGKGVYTGKDRDILLCVMNNSEMIAAKRIIKETDPKSFIIVTSAHEVYGEGFIPLEQK